MAGSTSQKLAFSTSFNEKMRNSGLIMHQTAAVRGFIKEGKIDVEQIKKSQQTFLTDAGKKELKI